MVGRKVIHHYYIILIVMYIFLLQLSFDKKKYWCRYSLAILFGHWTKQNLSKIIWSWKKIALHQLSNECANEGIYEVIDVKPQCVNIFKLTLEVIWTQVTLPVYHKNYMYFGTACLQVQTWMIHVAPKLQDIRLRLFVCISWRCLELKRLWLLMRFQSQFVSLLFWLMVCN